MSMPRLVPCTPHKYYSDIICRDTNYIRQYCINASDANSVIDTYTSSDHLAIPHVQAQAQLQLNSHPIPTLYPTSYNFLAFHTRMVHNRYSATVTVSPIQDTHTLLLQRCIQLPSLWLATVHAHA